MLVLFVLLTILVTTNNISWYDNFFLKFRNITDLNTTIFKVITAFGDWFILIILTILSVILIKDKKYSIYIITNLVLASIINTLLKLFFIRERPFDSIITETGYSYPSGHSFVSIAFYGFVIYLILRSNISSNKKYLFSSLLIILILLIGISRIYLGVHYPSDVLGGFVGGAIYLILYIEIIKKIEGEKNAQKK